MAFFQTLPSDGFTPLFQLLDDYDVHRECKNKGTRRTRSFTPKFDVKEVKDAYYLDGELPGVSQNDVEIEFTDPHTLVIRGKSERRYTAETVDENTKTLTEGDDSTPSKKHHNPTVEDEDDEGQTTKSVAVPSKPAKEDVVKKSAQPKQKFLLSERSVGEFQRVFNFPTRVDQNNVKASLRNGILSIVIPKFTTSTTKRIRIE